MKFRKLEEGAEVNKEQEMELEKQNLLKQIKGENLQENTTMEERKEEVRMQKNDT